ncbi:MAG: hypothetical protein ACRDNW_09575 [Trebonia sp.]
MNFAEHTAAAVSAIILLLDYLAGITFGIFGSAVFASVRENDRMSLLERAPDPISAGIRVFLLPFTRDDDGYLRSLPPGRGGAIGSSRGGLSPGSRRQGGNR